MKGTMDFYDKTAPEWAERGYEAEPEIPALLDFAKQFPRGSRFLDVCCGCGCESWRIHSLGYEAIGLDFSAQSLKIARERNPELIFYQENKLNDYSYIGLVDAVICIAGLVHIEEKDLSLAFSRMHRVLKEDGKLFLTVREGHGRIEKRSVQVIDGETYDRNFIGHSLDDLTAAASTLFRFEQEVGDDGTGWHNYIFKKNAEE